MRVGNQAALQELAERIAQADAVVIGGGSGLSSAAGYDHYHWSPALSEALAPFREQYGFTKGIRSAAPEFFHCDRRGRTANSCRSYADFYTVKCSCICDKFSVVCNQYRIIKILCDLCTSLRISRKDHITSYFTLCYLNMILSACIL